MGYRHINNLYKDTDILLFKECYALEKIHGTSAHITFKWQIYSGIPVPELSFFSGGASHVTFKALFNESDLLSQLSKVIPHDKEITIYGEAYGGKEQGMSHTYGKQLKFIVFDVQIGDCWLNVPDAEAFVKPLGLEFVHYVRVSTDLKALDAERDACSVQSVRNGVTTHEDFIAGKGKPREGIVLRPIKEMTLNNGHQVVSKHKGAAFSETASPRQVEVDPAKLAKLAEAGAIATEWCTLTRLAHVLDKIPDHCMEKMPIILEAMLEDVLREGAGEIDLTQNEQGIKKTIKSTTAKLYQQFLKQKLVDSQTTPA